MRRRDVTRGLLATGLAAPLISPTGANASNQGGGPDLLAAVDYITFGRQRRRVSNLTFGMSGEIGTTYDLSQTYPQAKDFKRTIFGREKLPFEKWVQLSVPIAPVRYDDNVLFAEYGIETQTVPVLIGDGKTVFLVGNLEKQKQVATRIPLLGDIPILGWLFKTREARESKQDLLIFLTAKIVKDQT